jgi:hypothetical protein
MIKVNSMTLRIGCAREGTGKHLLTPPQPPNKLSRTRRIHPTTIHFPKHINKTQVIPEPNTNHRTIENGKPGPTHRKLNKILASKDNCRYAQIVSEDPDRKVANLGERRNLGM